MYKKLSVIYALLSSSFLANAAATSELEQMVTAQGQLLTQYQQQLIDLQTEVDELRGQLQETSYKLEQTIERQRNLLKQSEAGPQNLTNNRGSSPANNKQQSVTSQNKSDSLAGWLPTGNDKDDYNHIIDFVLKGKESKNAIAAFQQFIKQYPKSNYQANANYWLGQLNYNQNKKNDASYYFAYIIKNYPNEPKAAESMYKLGLILLETDKKDKAKTVLKQVIAKYPNNANIVEQAKQQLDKL
ncbi:MAG: tol-pal system protein YbgF [Candidatus Schmidhempelia sp.]|nr:tol-pal system protein YbgF [Candidatus Schmidhempelia sp.]